MARAVLLGTGRGLRAVDGATVGLDGRNVTTVAPAGQGWLAVADHRTLVGSAGDPWAELRGVTATCVGGYGADVLVGTADAGLVRVDRAGAAPVAGFADAEGRSQWYTPWGGPPSTRSLTVAPDGAVHVNVHVGGILRSRDGGRSWWQTIDIDVDVHQVLADVSGVLLAACGAGGLAVSRDGGDTWRFDIAGLHARYCRAVAVAGDTVLVTAALGPRGGRAAVYRRPVGSDGAFERCTLGLPSWFDANIDTHRLAGRDEVAAFAAADGRVFVSDDAGSSWDDAGRVHDVSAVIIV